MKTISSVVESYIRRKPFLQTALSEGIINLTSLSRYIKPEVEEVLRKEVRDGAIVMALKRLSENLEFLATHKIVKVLKDIGEITVRSSLTDYTFQLTLRFFRVSLNLCVKSRICQIFFTLLQGG